ncbi:redoxin domain-containing protein [Ornithinibacillus sp. L9]|uniref:Redoxin domain-containing protein n=1 Tax=Ornithinibacillus caprae TaxID=2678566 RepID=A0A6N8FI73_9BACI|nr:redoxin domain-containing protein [Ornithinibacillus caprae]MUK88386.1 redoxin domain-containing protein [Ornithinibacillus caprae]
MKKSIFLLIVVGMVSWAIYDFSMKSGDTNSVEYNRTESEMNDTEIDVMAVQDNDKIGLNRGNIAPDFELTTLEGETVKLSDFRGEPVMINFWASWCGPCRSEMPDMQKFYQEKDITILAVNLTDTELRKKDVTTFVEEYDLSFPILMDEKSEVSDLYRIQPIPTSFLIDADGRVHNVAFGALSYEQMIQEYEQMN